MNEAVVNAIARAVLYEGYILYPYRRSVKNRTRWTFGGILPRGYCEAQRGGDAWRMVTECLVQGGEEARVEMKVKFLQVTARVAGRLREAVAERPEEELAFEEVEVLEVGGRRVHTWQEAVEREVGMGAAELRELAERPRRVAVDFGGTREVEPQRDEGGMIVGVLVRRQEHIWGTVEISADRLSAGMWKVRARIVNETGMAGAGEASRDEAMMYAFASTHTVLGVEGGDFVSLMDPPAEWKGAATGCKNEGTWPVLVGEKGAKGTMLSSPIILYDYPEIAAESPGDLFDGTEIDEILTLRIMTLTEEEKREAAAMDERGGAMLARTEALGRERMMGLHGVMRGVREVGR